MLAIVHFAILHHFGKGGKWHILNPLLQSCHSPKFMMLLHDDLVLQRRNQNIHAA